MWTVKRFSLFLLLCAGVFAKCPDTYWQGPTQACMDIVEKVDRVTNENFIEVPERLRAMCKAIDLTHKCLNKLALRCITEDNAQRYIHKRHEEVKMLGTLCQPEYKERMISRRCYSRFMKASNECDRKHQRGYITNALDQKFDLGCRALGDYLNCHEEIKESQIRSNCKDAAAAEYHLNIISPVVLKSKPFAERYCFEKMKPSHRQWYVISASAATGVTSVFSVMVAAFIVALL